TSTLTLITPTGRERAYIQQCWNFIDDLFVFLNKGSGDSSQDYYYVVGNGLGIFQVGGLDDTITYSRIDQYKGLSATSFGKAIRAVLPSETPAPTRPPAVSTADLPWKAPTTFPPWPLPTSTPIPDLPTLVRQSDAIARVQVTGTNGAM